MAGDDAGVEVDLGGADMLDADLDAEEEDGTRNQLEHDAGASDPGGLGAGGRDLGGLADQPGGQKSRDDVARGRAVELELARQFGPAQPAEPVQRPEGGDLVALPDAARRGCGERGLGQRKVKDARW